MAALSYFFQGLLLYIDDAKNVKLIFNIKTK